MPDIAMCANEACPSHAQCHRFTATPSPVWQTYAGFVPEPDEDRCDSFWPNKEGKS